MPPVFRRNFPQPEVTSLPSGDVIVCWDSSFRRLIVHASPSLGLAWSVQDGMWSRGGRLDQKDDGGLLDALVSWVGPRILPKDECVSGLLYRCTSRYFLRSPGKVSVALFDGEVFWGVYAASEYQNCLEKEFPAWSRNFGTIFPIEVHSDVKYDKNEPKLLDMIRNIDVTHLDY